MAKAIIPYLIFLVSLTDPVLGETRRVPADYATIQAAIDACDEGDTVLVALGTYTGTGNRRVFISKSITIKSEQGPLTCIIDCHGSEGESHWGFYFYGRNDVNAALEGFTIMNGSGGVIRSQGVNFSMRNCILTGNVGWGDSGAMFIAGSVTASNCIITGNIAKTGINQAGEPSFSYGGGVFLLCDSAVFRNCVITGNKADFGGGVAWVGKGTASFENCIIYDNKAVLGQGSQAYAGFAGGICPAGPCYPVGDVVFAYCCVDDDPNAFYYEKPFPGAPNEVFRLDDCIMTSPGFAKSGYWDPNGTPDHTSDDYWVDGDYHLKSQAGRWDPETQSWVKDDVTSPCIDAGDPNSPIGYEPFPNGGRINMGAYGATAEASKSYFGEPVCETIVAGDLNGDCKVDFQDLTILASRWLTQN